MRSDKPAARVIALEEAFLHPRLWELFPPRLQQRYAVVKDGLTDLGPARIRRRRAPPETRPCDGAPAGCRPASRGASGRFALRVPSTHQIKGRASAGVLFVK